MTYMHFFSKCGPGTPHNGVENIFFEICFSDLESEKLKKILKKKFTAPFWTNFRPDFFTGNLVTLVSKHLIKYAKSAKQSIHEETSE